MSPLTCYFLVVVIFLGVGVALSLWLDNLCNKRLKKSNEQWIQAKERRDKVKCANIEKGMREWLEMLCLPQLEDKTKLEEVARRLRIVLVEKLINGPRVR